MNFMKFWSQPANPEVRETALLLLLDRRRMVYPVKFSLLNISLGDEVEKK